MFKTKKSSIVSQIIALFLIINLISLAFYTAYIYQLNKRINMQYVEDSLKEISQEKSDILVANLDHIKAESQSLAYVARELLLSQLSGNTTVLDASYARDSRGILGRSIELSEQENRTLGISNIYLPSNIDLNPLIEQEIIRTEKLDPMFNQILERNKYIQWAYFTTSSGMMRLSPYVANTAYESDHDQRLDVFYESANEKNNPERKTVWTDPYYDYLMTGWMITCSTPIYDGDRLLGVLSLDLRLGTLREDILADFRLSNSGFAFLIDDTGKIIYHPDVIDIGSQQGGLLERSIFDTELNSTHESIIMEMMRGSTGIGVYRADGDVHMIAYSQIPEQRWALGIDANQNDFLVGNNLKFSDLYLFLIVSLLLFSILSAIVYIQYAKPFKQLTGQATMLSEGIFEKQEIISNFSEIEILSDTFNTMSDKLKEYTGSLIQRTHQVETVFNSIGGLLMILSLDMDIKMLNRKGRYRFSRLNSDILGTRCYRSIGGNDAICENCGFEEALTTGKPVHRQIAKGTEIFSNAYYPIVNDEGIVEEVIVYSQNITSRTLMEKELAHAEKLAGIGQLSSAIAHELKNPLAIMKGASYLLRRLTKKDDCDPSIPENFDIIDSSIRNAEDVIYNLLAFSARSRQNHETVDLGKILEQILLLEKRNLTKSSIRAGIFLDPSPFVIDCQSDALKHILLNLIANAIQAMPSGGDLTISGRFIHNDERTAEISIADTGKGIPFELQNEIFKPFFTAREGEGGTGLGLWITKLAVEKMSGEIRIQSIPEKGTTFTLLLPVSQKKED